MADIVRVLTVADIVRVLTEENKTLITQSVQHEAEINVLREKLRDAESRAEKFLERLTDAEKMLDYAGGMPCVFCAEQEIHERGCEYAVYVLKWGVGRPDDPVKHEK